MNKRILLFLVFAMVTLFFCGCGIKVVSQQKQANIILNELIVALENEDAEAIKSMLAADLTVSSESIDDEIQDALELFDGKVISYDKLETVSGGESFDNGALTYSRISNGHTEKIVTDTDTYKMSFSAILINKKKKTQEGLWQICIENSNGNYVIIGSNNFDFN